MMKSGVSKFASIIFATLIITGCSTLGSQSSNSGASRGEILSKEPTSVGAAINAGREVLAAYQIQLNKAQNTRRNVNLGVIGTGLYTAIAAGTGAHLHNIVASTAIGGALQLAEPNLQTNGSPESLGSAMTKTVCIIRAAEATQSTENLLAVGMLERSFDNRARDALRAYGSLKSTVLSAIMQVNIDQAVSSTPALLDGDSITKKLKIKSDEEKKVENAAPVMPAGSKAVYDPTADIAKVTTTAQIVNDSIKNCLAD